MINSMNSRKSAARVERQQQKLDAGFVAARFPEVANIAITMTYNQRGTQQSLSRVVQFFPDSYALFKIDCLTRECVDGGFDLTQVITGMIRSRRDTATGALSCEGEGPSANHSTIAYEVAIRYTQD
jgi:hypothetical protein